MPVGVHKKAIERCLKCGGKFKRRAMVCGLCAMCENERLTKWRSDVARRKRLAGTVVE